MARLLSCGFELQSVTAGMEWDADSGAGTKSISTTTVRSGAAALRVNPTASHWYTKHQYRPDSSTGKVFIRFYLRIATAPDANTGIIMVGNTNVDTGANGLQLQLNTDRTLQLNFWNGASQTNVGSPSSALSIGTWYRIELTYDDSVAGNTITARIDGAADFASGNGGDLGGNGFICWGNVDDCTTDIFYDDIAINDDTGSAQTSFPGAGSIVHMHPTASGDNAVATGTFADIDEVTPDDGTTKIVVATATTEIGEYNCESASNAGIDSYDTVTLVSVGIRFGNVSAASANFALRIKSASGGTTTIGGTVTGAVTAYNTHDDTAGLHQYKLTSYTDPTTGLAWTPTGTNSLDNMQIGVYSPTDATPDINVSTLWALVEYVDGAAPSGTVVKDIIGVGVIPFAR